MWTNNWQILSAVLYIMNLGLAIYAATSLIMRRRDPIKTLSWVIVLILLPYFGLILYFFFGQNIRKQILFSIKNNADYRFRKEISSSQIEYIKKNPNILGDLLPYKKIIFQNLNNNYTAIERNSKVDFYFIGRETLDEMYLAISMAKQHIHLQSYIIEDDKTGNRFADLLISKAKKGLEVRLMYDGVGGISLKRDFLNRLRENGVEVLCFSKVRFLMPTSKLNYRNHRKILVIDGKIGFIGGVNIADRYYYGTEVGDWHDTHIKIVGESVFSLQASFLLDRYFILNRKIGRRKKYYPSIELSNIGKEIDAETIATQTLVSGPDSHWSSIMQCFFSAITSAKKNIYIVTPYFTPNQTILNALKIAALGNIDVKIMLPERSDTIITHYSTMSYITELLEAGVKIYLFKKGFNHSKVISIDRNICIVGSANMDFRSFELNFEIMQIMYNKNCTSIIDNQFIKDCRKSKQIFLSKWKKRSKKQKIAESVARLCSPLL